MHEVEGRGGGGGGEGVVGGKGRFAAHYAFKVPRDFPRGVPLFTSFSHEP